MPTVPVVTCEASSAEFVRSAVLVGSGVGGRVRASVKRLSSPAATVPAVVPTFRRAVATVPVVMSEPEVDVR